MNVIKVARAKKDMSVNELADRMNVSRQLIWNWENKKTVPPVSKVIDLHLILEIPINDLMEYFNNKEEK